MIVDRLDKGMFPLGGSRIYSISELNLPTIPAWERGPIFNATWPSYAQSMIDFANSQSGFNPLFEGDVNVYGQLNWVNFPLGYRQFRRVVGLNDARVDLQLTGQMIHDLIVTADSSQTRNFIGARILNGKFIKGKVGSGNKVVGKITLNIEFNNPASEILAGYIENGRHPRRFLFWTSEEQTVIADAYSDAVRLSAKGKDPLGVFRKFGF